MDGLGIVLDLPDPTRTDPAITHPIRGYTQQFTRIKHIPLRSVTVTNVRQGNTILDLFMKSRFLLRDQSVTMASLFSAPICNCNIIFSFRFFLGPFFLHFQGSFERVCDSLRV